MKRLLVRIETENAAFSGRGLDLETARLLRKVADEIERHGVKLCNRDKLMDVNGNTVGSVSFGNFKVKPKTATKRKG
jgi:hypothetical protein